MESPTNVFCAVVVQKSLLSIWSPSSNMIAWRAYLGQTKETGGHSSKALHTQSLLFRRTIYSIIFLFPCSHTAQVPFASWVGSLSCLPSLSAVPARWSGVGWSDLFHDESTSFAARLLSHDVEVQSKVYSGVPHGFDGSPAFSFRSELWSSEVEFIQQFREPRTATTYLLTSGSVS